MRQAGSQNFPLVGGKVIEKPQMLDWALDVSGSKQRPFAPEAANMMTVSAQRPSQPNSYVFLMKNCKLD